jgi:hypothetical protein
LVAAKDETGEAEDEADKATEGQLKAEGEL